jgi:hypothetical protein
MKKKNKSFDYFMRKKFFDIWKNLAFGKPGGVLI